jgi:hypothetical protein
VIKDGEAILSGSQKYFVCGEGKAAALVSSTCHLLMVIYSTVSI